jgi:hypothetical protein
MKEGFDREIDSLLRRRARGTAESRAWGDGAGERQQAAHLDADELGAFAEGALPVAARVAAASHLADCERCRGIVIGLAPAARAGAEVKPQSVAAARAAGPERTPAWRALLASLFTPRAMRLAVPALVLSLVGVVSYVALRSDRGAGTQSAMNTGSRRTGTLQDAASAPAQSTAANANANTSGLADQNANTAPVETTATTAQPVAPRGHGAAESQPVEVVVESVDARPPAAAPAPPPPPPAAAATEGPAEMSKSAPAPVAAEEGEVARTENRDRSESREKSARASEPAEEVAVTNDAAPRNRAAPRSVNEVQMPDGGSRNQQKRAADNSASNVYGGGAVTATPPKESEGARPGSRTDALGRMRAARRAEKKADDEEAARGGETRTAAGRRFRREGNAWVDVNYKPSMPSTGVRRGTEAFRALVADVPEVGRVAEALGGEVVVVVGGRAYRIR